MTDTSTGASYNGHELLPAYDVIVCGSGSSGSVARRLSDNPDLQVLLVEAGGDDHSPSQLDPARWAENIGGEADWNFTAEPNPRINGRSIPISIGKALGGGSAINVMTWARGHRRDWDYFAEASGDPAWGYEAVLDIYRRIEDRQAGGLAPVTRSDDPSPLACAFIEVADALGIPAFDRPNGPMMEARAGVAPSDWRIDEDGRRTSLFSAYVRPVLDRPNLTVLTEARVLRVLFEGRRAAGVEVSSMGETRAVRAAAQVVLSTGAILTPQLLMLSGVGDREQLAAHGIDVVQHLSGVGQGLEDHTAFPMTWAHPDSILPRGAGSEAMLYATAGDGGAGPDILMCQAEVPIFTPESGRYGVPEHGWSMMAALARPKSRGQVRLRSADPLDPPVIELNSLSDPDDLRMARKIVELSREIGAAQPFVRLGAQEAVPAPSRSFDTDAFIRDGATAFWHESCTARMGRDAGAVVDADLSVYGVEGLTIADASIMPRITTGNTMAPCVVIGERAGEILSAKLM